MNNRKQNQARDNYRATDTASINNITQKNVSMGEEYDALPSDS